MKPYLLFKNKLSPYWYAQIRLPDGTLTSNKSTRKESRAEAERVAMEWIVKGNLPTSYGKKGRAKETTSLEFISVLNALKTIDFTEDEITSIISALKERRIITSAITLIIHRRIANWIPISWSLMLIFGSSLLYR